MQVDEDTCKNYAIKFQDKVKKYAKISVLEKDVGINLLKVMFDVKNVKELKRKYPHKKFDSVSDETYPAIKGAKKKFEEINRWRKLRGEELLKLLRKKYPNFVVDGNFIGAAATNAMEGGNWRLKYELRTSYSNQDAITGRVILACLLDSIYTFRNGVPDESFAHKHTGFSFGKIMGC